MDTLKKHLRYSITTRLVVAVSILFSLALGGLGVAVYSYMKDEFKQTILLQQQALLQVMTDDIDKNLLGARNVIVNVSRQITPEICSNPEKAQEFLDNRPGTHSVFDNGLFLFSTRGRIIAESPFRDGRRGRDISFRRYFIDTMDSRRPVISEPYESTHTPGAPAVMFTAPVIGRDGTVIAVLGGSVNLLNSNFLGGIAGFKVGKSGYVYILNRDRTMVAHPDKGRIMKNPVPPGSNRLLDAALSGFEGGDENVNSGGLRSLSSFKRFREVHWIMGINYPVEEAYQPFYHLRDILITLCTLFILAGIVVIRTLMARATGTLVALAGHVRTLGERSGAARFFNCDRRDEVGLLAATLNSMIEHEDRNRELLVEASTHDAMTGLYNRQYFDCEIERLSHGRVAPVSVVIADINGLKACNDTRGHDAGDELIRSTAACLKESFRAEDVVARIGGDEFAAILPGIDECNARQLLERIRALVSSVPADPAGCRLSISLGCAAAPSPLMLPETIRVADSRMYEDKAGYYARLHDSLEGAPLPCA